MLAPEHHRALVEAFHAIQDKQLLGYAALDTKFERFALAAIATEINRRGPRLAHVEFPPRRDLVILERPLQPQAGRHLDAVSARIRIAYEAKAGQLFDFAPAQGTADEYMGGLLDKDFEKSLPDPVSGLFFISEATSPSLHLKYFKGYQGTMEQALAQLGRNVTRGRLVAQESIDCGLVGGATMRIHMLVFDRR